MPKALTIAALFAAASAVANPVFAESNCWVPMTEWQPRSAVEALADSKGWALRRIRIDDGCYEMIGTDTDGSPIEVKLHPKTLEILAVHKANDKNGAHKTKAHAD